MFTKNEVLTFFMNTNFNAKPLISKLYCGCGESTALKAFEIHDLFFKYTINIFKVNIYQLLGYFFYLKIIW